MQSSTRGSRYAVVKRIAAACVILVVFAFLVELAARAIDAGTPVSVTALREVYQKRRAWRLGPYRPPQRVDDPYPPEVPNPDHPGINEHGFKGPSLSSEKPAHAYRLFCLGGSTTIDGYPAYLMEALGPDFAAQGLTLEVVNAANDGHNSLDSTVNLITRCLPLKPDALVIYHAISDVVMAFSERHDLDGTRIRRRVAKDEPLWWDYLPSMLDRSAAFVEFRAMFERNIGTRGIPIDSPKELPSGERGVYHGLEPFRQNLYTLVSIARARGIEVFLVTQVFNRDAEYRFPLQRRWADGVDEANAITRSFANLWDDVHVIDAAASLRGGNDWMRDHCHFTERGKGRFASFLATSIRPMVPRLIDQHAQSGRLPLPAAPLPTARSRPGESSGSGRLRMTTADAH